MTPSFGCGGLEKVIANVVSHSDPDLFEHIVLSLSDDISFRDALPANTAIFSLHKKPGKDWLCHRRAYRFFKQFSPDVLHTYNFGTLEYHIAAKLAGIRTLIHSDHGLGGDHPQGLDRRHNLFRRGISTLLSHYVVVSEDLDKWVKNTVRVAPDNVKIIRNGVPVPDTRPERTLGVKHVLSVGRLAPVKNQKRLLGAFCQFCLLRKNIKAHLTIVGDGPSRQELEEQINQFPEAIQQRITLVGFHPDPSVFYPNADVFVLSSDYEAMPMTVLEAMSAGTPTLCPRVGGIPDSIPENTALLYPGQSEQELVLALLKWADLSQKEREALSVNGFALASDFSVKRMTQAYEELYRPRNRSS